MEERIEHLEQILEAAIMSAGEPLTIEKMQQMFAEGYAPAVTEIREALAHLAEKMQDRGIELVEVASGYRFQAKQEYANWLQRLWEKKPPRYSRALLETLALVVYRQPITRGEIEDVRGVAVSTQIMKILIEREWVKVVGYRDVPGKPALYGTTKAFLDYFNLKKLSDLPPLKEVVDLEELEKKMGAQLNLDMDVKKTELPLDISVNQKTDEELSETVLQQESMQIETEIVAMEAVEPTSPSHWEKVESATVEEEVIAESEFAEDEEIVPVGI